MANTKAVGRAKTVGSALLAGTLAFGMAHHLRADDPPGKAAGAGASATQTVEEAYKDAFKYMKTAGESGGDVSVTTIRTLKELPTRFPGSVDAQLVFANMIAFNGVNPSYTGTLADPSIVRPDFGKAIGIYDRILSQNPTNVAALVDRGVALCFTASPKNEDEAKAIGMGNMPDTFRKGFEQAIADFDHALQVDTNSFAAYYDKATALSSLGRSKEAIACFERAERIGLRTSDLSGTVPDLSREQTTVAIYGPSSAALISRFGKYWVDNWEAKTIDGKRIVQVERTEAYISNSNDVEALCEFHIGQCYAHADLHDYSASLRYFDHAIELDPDVYQYYQFRALVEFGTGRQSKADADEAKAHEVNNKINALILKGRGHD